MNSATKVSEIFTAAGSAFIQLGDLTMQLQPNAETNASGKWTDEEVDLLYGAILRFSDDLNKVSLSIKNRTVSQIRQALKQKAFEDAGIPAKKVPVQQVQHVIQTVQQIPNQTQQIHVVKTTNPQNVATVLQQQIIPIQQAHATATTTIASHQILQSTPKQIIIQQSPTATTNPTLSTAVATNSILTVPTTPVTIQQSAPQIVHLQPQVIQQQSQPQQQLITPQTLTTTTTTMTVQQFQQLQQQKLLLQSSNAAAAAVVNATTPSTISSNTPSIIENVVLQPAHITQPTTQQSATTAIVPATIVPTTSITPAATVATTTSSTISSDVMMTLNRLNVQEHEVDVEELPADVVKLDFASEEVTG